MGKEVLLKLLKTKNIYLFNDLLAYLKIIICHKLNTAWSFNFAIHINLL